MWTHEESIETNATAEHIWGWFEDVAGWKDWNAGIERIELHGPFVVGTTFTMQPPGQETFTSTLVEVEPCRSFTDKTVVDETVVLVSHKLEPLPSGRTRITYATSISGPDAAEVGPIVTEDFKEVLAALKTLAEAEPKEKP